MRTRRTIKYPGVYGERMLGGGDKGAAGCLVAADAVDAVKAAVDVAYPRSRPHLADKYAVHVARSCAVKIARERVLPGERF